MRVYNSNTGANVYAGIELGGAGPSNDGLVGINGVVTAAGSGALTFYTRDSNTFAERMRITSEGQVAIGATSNLNNFTIKSSSDTITAGGLSFQSRTAVTNYIAMGLNSSNDLLYFYPTFRK